MKIAFITAGAAGMYCGSCMRDNALARCLMARGHEVLLVPTYTPTRTDEPNVSLSQVFLGGINVYLQHRWALFRHTPAFADRVLDLPGLLNMAANVAVKTNAEELGALTVSMLQGEDGPDRKEFARLADWLAHAVQPDVVDISNALLCGLVGALRRRLTVPILCTLSGEDLWLDQLPEATRLQVLDLMRHTISQVDGFITFSHYYAGFMADYLGIPERKLFQVPLGISLEGHGVADPVPGAMNGRELTVGYLARISPQKGLHLLCEAFRILRERPEYTGCRLRVAGYLGDRDRPYWERLRRQIRQWGLGDAVEYAGELDRAAKIRFLQSLDVFSVPTVYRESKGLPVLEALANGVPVVQPWHGVFTEFVNATEGGLLVPPNDAQALADGIAQLLDNQPLRVELGRRGRQAVERSYTADRMADATLAVYQQFVRAR
jgi:glycosyltransferase involved in cell wall biosynthesis